MKEIKVRKKRMTEKKKTIKENGRSMKGKDDRRCKEDGEGKWR